MYKILRRTVDRVNEQTKSYFVDKLQVYDDLINEKETKLNEVNEKLENKKAELDSLKDTSLKNNYTFDNSIIDIMTDADYKEKDFGNLQKKIDSEFDIDYEKIILDFIEENVDDKDYFIAVNIKNKFDSKLIYKISSELDLEQAILNELDDSEKYIFLDYKKHNKIKKVNDFLNYLDDLIDKTSPYIEVQVANSKQNYDHLSKYIKTVVNDSIYRGIKIVYKNKVYDFSLNERDV